MSQSEVPSTPPLLRLDAKVSLVEPDETWLVSALAQPRPDARAALRVRLLAGSGVAGCVALLADEAAALALLPSLSACDADAGPVAAALAKMAKWISLEPTADPAQLSALVQQIHQAGARVLFDERRTFGWLASGCVSALVTPKPDAVLVGRSLAAGQPFAALIGNVPGADQASVAAVQCAVAVVEHLLVQPRAPRLAERLRELVQGIEAAAQEQGLAIFWRGEPSRPELHFADQDGADGTLIQQHFQLEAAKAGVHVQGPLSLSMTCVQQGVQAELAGLRYALARVRSLLIEYNSYLSGGLPYVWQGGDAQLRARGAMRYRYPKLAEVDVEAHGAGMRIAFAAQELGPVTSSGFYLPTRLTGDVDVAVRFVLAQFESGPDASCLGLFLQNEASSARYYCQVMCTTDAPRQRTVALGHAGRVIGRRTIAGDTGWLRLRRVAGEVVAYYHERGGEPWLELGRVPAVGDELIVGAKIWSKISTAGLVADLFDLIVSAPIANEQPTLLGEVPDPRLARQG